MQWHYLRTPALAAAFAIGAAGLAPAQLAPDQSPAAGVATGTTVPPNQPAPSPSINSRASDPLDWGLTPSERGFSPGETTGMGVREKSEINRRRGYPPVTQ